MPGIRVRSRWDNVPSECLVNICEFLSVLDLLNVCAAYPTFEPLLLNSTKLWKHVHLPFPDPLLFNYPGWRRESHTAAAAVAASVRHDNDSGSSSSGSSLAPSTCATPMTKQHGVQQSQSTSSSSSSKGSSQHCTQIPILYDDRYRFLSEPEYYNLPDIKGGEGDEQEENTAWVILDVLERVPLRLVQHLSFGTPPCHLCIYPCIRKCFCECHQNEQHRTSQTHDGHRSDHTALGQGLGLAQDHPTGTGEDGLALVEETATLSRPLQDFFESGVVDFNQHLDLRSLNRALASNDSTGPETGIGSHNAPDDNETPFNTRNHSMQHAYQPFATDVPTHHHGLNQLDLHEALLQLSLVDNAQEQAEGKAPTFSLTSAGNLTSEPEEDDEDIALTEEEDLEICRQQAETRAAYQRARLLIRILASGRLEALETLRVPWWPATRIYTIRQQLERWSFMIEQAIATASSSGKNNTERERNDDNDTETTHTSSQAT
ncbi:hypothetical protein BGZ94_002859 [Podila epigama]|nr:hypothetical protein BGZ94_002859 [Podila epigama]